MHFYIERNCFVIEKEAEKKMLPLFFIIFLSFSLCACVYW